MTSGSATSLVKPIYNSWSGHSNQQQTRLVPPEHGGPRIPQPGGQHYNNSHNTSPRKAAYFLA